MRIIFILSFGLLPLLGCSSIKGCLLPDSELNAKVDAVDEARHLVDACYGAIDSLLAQHSFPKDIDRVLVATVVDVNNVQSTTMFGRVTSDCLSSRLTQKDKDVIHATVRQDAMLIRKDGQFLLSREAKLLAKDYNARTALVCTYAVTDHSVVMSLKMVSTVEDSILAGLDVVMPRSPTISQMLAGWASPRY